MQVNVRHFKEFSEKSYGEKLFELLFAWVEKVNWTKLQIRDFIAIYAKEYQETFIDLFYRFHKYEVNEKIKTEELVHQRKKYSPGQQLAGLKNSELLPRVKN